jgi:hypothetical protein
MEGAEVRGDEAGRIWENKMARAISLRPGHPISREPPNQRIPKKRQTI